MSTHLLGKIRRGLRKPPHVIARRLAAEARQSLDRVLLPMHARMGSTASLLAATQAANVDELWQRLVSRPCLAPLAVDAGEYERLCPGDMQRILAAAQAAIERRVDLLGSGPVSLGDPIDWQRDFKTGFDWPKTFARTIDYNNPDRPSDVKVPWETSRVQWLIPLGQAYLLTREERYAAAARDVLESWMADNPVMLSVNWSCTMEIALRVLSWSWLLRSLHESRSWSDADFRARLLHSLYWHGKLTERYLEYSDINGNHCTADGAGMVFAGLLFGQGRQPNRWLRRGWQLLCDELPRQVYADGVDFEASTAYHRLVLELFLLPALYRQRCGLDVPAWYCERLIAMARFTQAYTRPDGTSPRWGDADDARALPLGPQALGDHRYLLGLVGAAWDVEELAAGFASSPAEVYWLLGADACRKLSARATPPRPPESVSFPQGGCYVMRGERDHVFIDCGPVGMSGRGGHGHNDSLSFEAMLDGVHLVSDCGAYVYTASYRERNLFRSTAYHNTPQVGDQEINRLIGPDNLWSLHDDAKPQVRRWQCGPRYDVFVGSHSGYERLAPCVRPVRTIVLDRQEHGLVVQDRFETERNCPLAITIPIHLAEGVTVEGVAEHELTLALGDRRFTMCWQGDDAWRLDVEPARVSPSYGVVLPTVRLVWRLDGEPATGLCVGIVPGSHVPGAASRWMQQTIAEAGI